MTGTGTRARLVLAALVLCLTPGTFPAVRAEESGTAEGAGERKGPDAPLEWRQVGRDARYVFGRPAHLDRAGWFKLAAVVGTGAALYTVRKDIRDAVQRNRTDSIDRFLDDARNMGKLGTPLATALGFYLVGKARDSEYDRETSMLLLETLAFAGAVTGTAQKVIATDRPEVGDRVRFFGSNGHSVSGDVTIAASMLAPIIDRHLRTGPADGGGTRFWKHVGTWGLYGTAGLTALQRMDRDRHWAPDVFLGYASGLGIGRLLVDSHRGGRGWRDGRGRVAFDVAPGGVRITWR
jgi:hypothetical protein